MQVLPAVKQHARSHFNYLTCDHITFNFCLFDLPTSPWAHLLEPMKALYGKPALCGKENAGVICRHVHGITKERAD